MLTLVFVSWKGKSYEKLFLAQKQCQSQVITTLFGKHQELDISGVFSGKEKIKQTGCVLWGAKSATCSKTVYLKEFVYLQSKEKKKPFSNSKANFSNSEGEYFPLTSIWTIMS